MTTNKNNDKSARIISALGSVDERYIPDTASEKKGRRRFAPIGIAAVAACLAVAVGVGVSLGSPKHGGRQYDLPMLTISGEEEGAGGGMGRRARDISELVNANPWSEDMQLETLPVFRNPLEYDENFFEINADWEKMKEVGLEMAARLSVLDGAEVTDDAPSDEQKARLKEKLEADGSFDDELYAKNVRPHRLVIKNDGVTITVNADLTATAEFDPAVALPDGCRLSHVGSYGEMSDAAGYILERYRELIGMEQPVVNISGGEYLFGGSAVMDAGGGEYVKGESSAAQLYEISFFEGGGDAVERILNYNLHTIRFYPDDDDRLFIIRQYNVELSDKVGDYPVISAAQAKKQLAKGHYLSLCGDFPGVSKVVKTELVYRYSAHEEYIMPYYLFYAEMPSDGFEDELGLRCYGEFYVPAVESGLVETPLKNGFAVN